MSVFVGRRRQRGHGLGQTIGGLLKRFVIPFIAPHAKKFGKQLLSNAAQSGMHVMRDVMGGRKASEAIKEHAVGGIKRTIGDFVRQSPFGVGSDNSSAPKRSRVNVKKKKKTTKQKKKKKGKSRDIFN